MIKDRIELFLMKSRLSLGAIARTLKNYKYFLLAILISFLFFEFLYWSLNYNLLWFFVVTPNLSILEKINLILSTAISYFYTVSIWQSLAIFALSIIQGVVLAQVVFIVKYQKRLDVKAFGGSTIASLVALLGVGCPSCGSSLVAPVVGLFVSGVSVGLTESIHQVSVFVGLLFAVYALYAIGQNTANIYAKIDNQ